MWYKRKSEILNGGLQTGNTNISAFIQHNCKISKTTPMFSKSINSKKLFHILCDASESRKSENGGFKRGNTNSSACIEHSWNFLETKNMYFEVDKFHWAVSHNVWCKHFSANRNGGSQTENTYISVCIQYSCSIPTVIPMFSRSKNSTKLFFIICDACGSQKSKMATHQREILMFWIFDLSCIIRY